MGSALLAFACFLFFAQDRVTTDQETTATAAPAEVKLKAKNSLEPALNSGNRPKAADDTLAQLDHSAAFRKAAEEAWRATHNGAAPFEAGFSIDKGGHPGKIQLSIFETVNAKTHLSIGSSPMALGSLHVHNKYGEPTPSPADIRAAETTHKMVYVESRKGLYSVDPDGNVRHIFMDENWFNKKQ